MPEPVNLADVARLAKVSPATASRALSDHPHVAAATRARVWDAARALEYVVSPDASGLARGTTGRIAVVVPHLSRWWFGAALEGLADVLRGAGRDLLLYHLGDAAARRAFFAELPARRRADAVVLLDVDVDVAERARLERIGVGIVSAGTRIGHHPSVSIDDAVAGRQAVDHLLHLGHRRIGMIVTTDPELDPGQPEGRAAAYRAALADAGVAHDPALTVTVPWSPEGGARAMGELLGLSDPPTAVYAHTDEVALGAVGTLRRAGLAVPATCRSSASTTTRSPCSPTCPPWPSPRRNRAPSRPVPHSRCWPASRSTRWSPCRPGWSSAAPPPHPPAARGGCPEWSP